MSIQLQSNVTYNSSTLFVNDHTFVFKIAGRSYFRFLVIALRVEGPVVSSAEAWVTLVVITTSISWPMDVIMIRWQGASLVVEHFIIDWNFDQIHHTNSTSDKFLTFYLHQYMNRSLYINTTSATLKSFIKVKHFQCLVHCPMH